MDLKQQLNKLSQKFQSGGETSSSDWKKKYSNNPYFKDREDWGEKLDVNFPNSKVSARKAVYDAARRTGIDPGLLYTSSMEEGMKLALSGQDTFERRAGYNEFRTKDPKAAKEYPVDGGYFYGLNTFGDKYGKIIKPSLMPQGFKYSPYQQKNPETGEVQYTSGAFRSHEDAIAAKAAMMRQVQDAITARLKNNNIKISPEARKFFDMVGYNMGEDKTVDMIKSFKEKGYLQNDKFLDPNFQPVSWKEPYLHVQRRYQNYKILNEQGYFNDYKTSPQMVGTPSPKPLVRQSGGYSTLPYDEADAKNFTLKMLKAPWYKSRIAHNGYLENTKDLSSQIKLLNSIVGGRIKKVNEARIDNVYDDNGINNIKRKANDYLYNAQAKVLNKLPAEWVEKNVENLYIPFNDINNGSYYRNDNGKITFNRLQLNDLGADPNAVITHEYSHAETSNGLSDYELYLMESKMGTGLKSKNRLSEHNSDPYETKADINAIRYNLHKTGDFDPNTGKYKTKDGKFHPSLLHKVKNDFSAKRLRNIYSTENLTEIMNTIASNSETSNDIAYAQSGGTIKSQLAQLSEKFK